MLDTRIGGLPRACALAADIDATAQRWHFSPAESEPAAWSKARQYFVKLHWDLLLVEFIDLSVNIGRIPK